MTYLVTSSTLDSASLWAILIASSRVLGFEAVTFPSMLLGDLVGLLYPNRLGICIPPRQGIVGFLLGLLAFAMAAAYAFRTAATPFVISCQIAASIIAGVADDRDTEMDDSTGVATSLCEIYLEGKKYWESDIGDCDNTGDGSKTAGRARITWGGEIALSACMASIYGSSCKGEKTSVSKRYLVKSFKELGELFLGIVGKYFGNTGR
nr:hypothetical protein [Tanacetum cinerariifolium]